MMDTGTVRVVEQTPEQDSPGSTDDLPTEELTTAYDDADPVEVGDWDYPIPGFVDAILDEVAPARDMTDLRLVDRLAESEDVDEAYLFAFPDQALMFLGSDPTAKDAVPWFTFFVEPAQPIPEPETCTDALDLLKPPEVQDLFYEEEFLPGRHGEWWLIPCNLVPAGTVFEPGVGAKPYGPSPLGNHVPQAFAFTVPDDVFLNRFHRAADAPESVASVPEALRWTRRNLQKVNPPEHVPDWADIRSFAEEVLVKGSIYHRDDDHYVERLGETWHKAQTHDIEVYTADAVGNVHMDYYGR